MTERTVLIVDDSPTMRKMVSFALCKQLGWKGKELQANDGLEGLDILSKEVVDLVICDVNMPNMNGLELLKQVKRDEQLKKTPFVMLTTEGKETDKERALRFGADGYLVKPFRPDALKAVLQELHLL